jgi:hypothetical protein
MLPLERINNLQPHSKKNSLYNISNEKKERNFYKVFKLSGSKKPVYTSMSHFARNPE